PPGRPPSTIAGCHMSPHAWTEDQLVEQPAIGLFAALGWQTESAMGGTFGARPARTLRGFGDIARLAPTAECAYHSEGGFIPKSGREFCRWQPKAKQIAVPKSSWSREHGMAQTVHSVPVAAASREDEPRDETQTVQQECAGPASRPRPCVSLILHLHQAG
ncbi:MAG: hypothetical protein RL215_459, partial [Planctomycetota bacterium]